MRYFITTHGCFRKKETIDLKGVHLLFHAYENECVKYNNAYLRSFCKDSINKLKGKQKPVFTATNKYYEMEFGKQEGDKFDSYIQCCTTGEIIYDFINGDLLLSDVIDIIKAHHDLYDSESPIYVSVLTCNTECSDFNTNYGTTLHRSISTKNTPNRYPANKNNWNTVRKSARNTRKQNMNTLSISKGTRKHRLKLGNSVIHPTKGTKTVVTIENKKKLKARGSYFLPEVESGNTVLYHNELWRIMYVEGEGEPVVRYILEHFRERNENGSPLQITVDAREVIKLEF